MEQIKCDLCDRVCIGISALRGHKLVSHGIEPETVKKKATQPCNACGKQVSIKSENRKNHFYMNHPTEEQIAKIEVKCDNCSEEFANAYELNNHLPHCIEDLKKFDCDRCSVKNWHSALALKRHLAETHGKIFHVCPVKGCILKASPREAYLQEHIAKVHEKVRNYECHFCNKTFADNLTLKRHVGVKHEGIGRALKCDKCDYVCANLNKLKVHNNSKHTHAVAWNCRLCTFSCWSKGGLKQHTNFVHKKIRPYGCDFCDQRFNDKKSRRKHCFSIHSIQVEDS